MDDPHLASSLVRSEGVTNTASMRWGLHPCVAGIFPDRPQRELPRLTPPPSLKDLPKGRAVEPLDVPERMGRVVFLDEATADAHGNRRVRVRCAIEHGGCGLVYTMTAWYYRALRRGHCGCLGQTDPHPALDRPLTIDGRTLPLVAHVRAAMAAGVHIDFQLVKRRIVEGMAPERAVTTPMRRWNAS